MNLDKILKDRGSDEIWVNEFTEDSARDFRNDVTEAAKSDPGKPIVIYIDSYGGQVDSLASMIETMDQFPNPFVTVAVGKAMSCGAVLLSHGDIRFCGKHSRIMIHEVSGVTGGDVHDMHADAMEIKRLNEHFMGLLAQNCGIKGGYSALRKMIKDRDGRDNYLNSDQAVKFGIVDVVGMPKIEKMAVYQVNLVANKKRREKMSKNNELQRSKNPKQKNVRSAK
jgi:ATP-dependent Clp protease protease subunit